MRILSLVRRFGAVGRAALPLLASVQQPVSSLVAGRELAAARKVVQPSFNMVPIVTGCIVLSVLVQPPDLTECMGKRMKKDSVLEDDHVSHIIN